MLELCVCSYPWIVFSFTLLDFSFFLILQIFDNTSLSLIGVLNSSKKDTQPVKPMLTPSGPATIPPHSLAAFGLFLRLPGYAEVLLKEQKKARFLLRLMLGVNEDKDGS